MKNTQAKFTQVILGGITIILMFLMTSCDRPQSQHSTNDTINTDDVFKTDEEVFSSWKFNYYKSTIKIDGIKHEYITVNGYRRYAITHYPECKFCKQKKEKQND